MLAGTKSALTVFLTSSPVEVVNALRGDIFPADQDVKAHNHRQTRLEKFQPTGRQT
ncbi:MAG: hypothetical protein ACI9ON_001466 [Limisphaerales bacterium]|jgi:hypothetical protein